MAVGNRDERDHPTPHAAHPLTGGRYLGEAPAPVVLADGRIDNDEAEAFIQGKLASRYQIEQIAYDERFFDDQAKRLSDAGFVVTPMTPSAEPTRKAWDRFHELAVTDGVIVHDGDRVLSAHVAAAAGTMTDRGWRVSKLKQSSPIDALAAGRTRGLLRGARQHEHLRNPLCPDGGLTWLSR